MADTLEDLANLLHLGPEKPDQPPRFAKVTAISGDTVTVQLGSSTVDAVRCTLCSVGDVVLLETLPSGQLAATGTKGIQPSTGQDTTYDLTSSVSSHTFTATLSGSDGSSDTVSLTLAAGSNISLTDSGNTITIDAKDTTYSVSTDTIGSASAGTAIPADDITSWNAGTLPAMTMSVSGECLTFGWNAGSIPTLNYTAKSIPNISVTSKTVVTAVTAD